MFGSAWSLIPFLIVIPVSIVTRQVLPGLILGLLVGAFMLHPTFLGGINATITYILRELAVPDNLRLIVFLYGFGAFVGLVRVTGGVTGFAHWMERRIQTVRGAFAVTWLSSLVTFMAPDFRIITVAPVMRHVFDKLKVPSSLVAYIIDLTSTPLCALVPIGTVFVGYMVGLIGTTGRLHGHIHNPFNMLLLSLPWNLFAILMLLYGLFRTFVRTNVKIMGDAQTPPDPARSLRNATVAIRSFAFEHAAEITNVPIRRDVPDVKREESFPDAIEMVSEETRPHASHLVAPLFALLVLTLFFTWWDGHARSTTVLGALAQANAAKAMLEALLLTLLGSLVWYSMRRQPLHKTMWAIVAGGNEMMSVIVLLVLVWGVSAVSTDLGFVQYTQRTLGGLIPSVFIAPALFLFGCLISYVIGSSFGTWGMLLPLGYSLAASTGASFPLITGAVFASGTFGGFASPLSDNTVAMATVMKLPVVQYARYKLKSAILIAGVCVVLYAAFGWLLSNVV